MPLMGELQDICLRVHLPIGAPFPIQAAANDLKDDIEGAGQRRGLRESETHGILRDQPPFRLLVLDHFALQRHVRFLQFGRPLAHQPLQPFQMALRLVREVPFLRERIRDLAHLGHVERLLEHQQAVAVAELLDQIVPGKIRIPRADHDLQVETFLPNVADGLDAIPTGRHAHVDEGHSVWTMVRERPAHAGESFLPLECEINLELRETCLARGVKGIIHRAFADRNIGSARQHAGENAVQGFVVVHDQNAIGLLDFHRRPLSAWVPAWEKWGNGRALTTGGCARKIGFPHITACKGWRSCRKHHDSSFCLAGQFMNNPAVGHPR